jgi:hypothetical protein
MDILKEITGDASGIWYHGSTANINQADLDPLFRQNKGKEFMTAKAAGEGNTGSQNSTGIYFGKDKECIDAFCPMNYTGFNSEWAKEGFMYEMKLKSTANVKDHSALHNVYKTQYEKFRQEGIDVLISGNELNVLNVDAIDYFKKIMQWKIVPGLFPFNNRGEKGEKVIFNDDQELLDYVKKELGDFRLVKAGDSQFYQPTDENVRKTFKYSTERKWFDV